MAENDAPHGAPETPENTVNPTSADTDWQAEARKWEKRSKENLAVAKANEEAAQRLAAFEESQKTEAQKLQDERDQAKAELAAERAARLRAEVAATKGIPANLLSGSTQEELEASADALIAFKGEQQVQKLHVPNEGKSPTLALNGDGLEDSLRKALGIN